MNKTTESFSKSDESIAEKTWHWVNALIVALNLCPFAKREIDLGRVRLMVWPHTQVADGLANLIRECQWLDEHAQIETSLLVLPKMLDDFGDYLDFVELAEQLLSEQGYEGVYQLATFHPDYCFAGCNVDDVTNYTNRSPYPMLHLLREASLEQAIEHYGDTNAIPERNVALLKEMGLTKLQALLVKGESATCERKKPA
ncbi:DUF1415 domain-containing protein [Celerinatantimonas yamalensis]|uniref:DUF1415 domain-containing protein n=1 Tax=Celerinatantimonas yamalensis TaxID=559956 RepID=A0ABW9G7N0_9GAMM